MNEKKTERERGGKKREREGEENKSKNTMNSLLKRTSRIIQNANPLIMGPISFGNWDTLGPVDKW